jgi:hypothetical protein
MIWHDPPKGFSVDRYMEKVKAIRQQLHVYDGSIVSEPLIEDMIGEICSQRRYRESVLLRDRLPMILPIAGETINGKALSRVGMFLLEYDTDLRSGKLPPGWNGTPTVWVAGVIGDVCKAPSTKPGSPLRYSMKVVAINGPPAGQILPSNITPRYAMYLPKLLGVPKRTDINIMPYDAIGMYLMARYGAMREKSVSLLETQVSSSMKTKNKRLFNRRHP